MNTPKRTADDRFPSIFNKWGLTNREVQVLKMTVDGKTGMEIAGALCLSIKTVHTFFQRLRVKMGVKTLIHAALLWDREFYERVPPIQPIEVLRKVMNREPNEVEVKVNLDNWQRNPLVYKTLVEGLFPVNDHHLGPR